MPVLGHGFLARNLAELAPGFPGVLFFAQGVANTSCADPDQFRRERDALIQAVHTCRAESLRLVYFSTASASIYGAPGCRGREDEPVQPVSAYGRHKLAMEELAGANPASLILRTTHLVGPGQPARHILPGLSEQVRSGVVTVYPGARRDLLDVVDAVFLIGCLLRRRARGVVNLASGYSVPVEELLVAIEQRLGQQAERALQPAGAPSAVRIDVSRLHALAPEAARLGFGPDYYRTLVQRYLSPVAV